MVGVPETTDRDLQYHVLPDDPLAALNVLRQAAGREPLPSDDSTEESGYWPATSKQGDEPYRHFAIPSCRAL